MKQVQERNLGVGLTAAHQASACAMAWLKSPQLCDAPLSLPHSAGNVYIPRRDSKCLCGNWQDLFNFVQQYFKAIGTDTNKVCNAIFNVYGQ